MVYISRKLKTSRSEKNEDMCSIHIYHLYLGKKLCTCSKQDTEIMFFTCDRYRNNSLQVDTLWALKGLNLVHRANSHSSIAIFENTVINIIQ